MAGQITIRSDRATDYKFMYKGEEVVLKLISVKENDSTYSNLSTYLSTKQTL